MSGLIKIVIEMKLPVVFAVLIGILVLACSSKSDLQIYMDQNITVLDKYFSSVEKSEMRLVSQRKSFKKWIHQLKLHSLNGRIHGKPI